MTFPDENGGDGYVGPRENGNSGYTVKQAYDDGKFLGNLSHNNVYNLLTYILYSILSYIPAVCLKYNAMKTGNVYFGILFYSAFCVL